MGAVRIHGTTAMALVGTPQEVATGILELGKLGISQFILSGWPKQEEMRRFGSDVLPLVRAQERASCA
jgi:alkanesulfonate monooxygenase